VSTASSPEEAVHKFILSAPEETVTVDGVKPDDWLKVVIVIVEYAFLFCCKAPQDTRFKTGARNRRHKFDEGSGAYVIPSGIKFVLAPISGVE